MKDFSPLEKQMIDKIIEIDEKQGLNVLPNILEKRFSDFSYYIQVNKGTPCSINITEEHIDEIGKSIGGLDRIKYIIERSSKDIFIAVKLIQYLESEGLAYTVGSLNLDKIGSRIEGAKYISYSGFPGEIEVLLNEYIGKQVIPTQSLVIARGKGFISDEEIRFIKGAFWTRATVALSALAVVISTVAVIISSTGVTSTKVLNIPETIKVQLSADDAKNLQSGISTQIANSTAEVKTSIKANSEAIQMPLYLISENLESISGTLLKLLEEEQKTHSQSPALTPTAVTPPARQEARQP